MQTLEAQRVAKHEVTALSELTESLPETSPLRGFLVEILTSVRNGADISVVAQEQQISPSLASKMLGVSRVHVYKLMDRGDLPFVRVGNDRRTTLAHVEAFKRTQAEARMEMARRAAHPGATREAALRAL